LESPTVSGEHASLYFEKNVWNVRDLGSRNGTLVNGKPIPLRRSVALKRGDKLQFGGTEEPVWVLEDDTAPLPCAIGPNGQRVHGSEHELWLPDTEEPALRVHLATSGWIVETALQSQPTADGAHFMIEGQDWVLELPPILEEESGNEYLSTAAAQDGQELCLRFSISLDEEHVDLRVQRGTELIPLGARAHNYPLLLLARKRIADQQEGIDQRETGWMYANELRNELHLDRLSLNLQLWRAAQRFKKAALPGDRLVERRDDSRQIRIGLDSTVSCPSD
jgi:hypothetical protein